MQKNLHISEKSCTFAPDLRKDEIVNRKSSNRK